MQAMPVRDTTREQSKYSRHCNLDAWYWGYKTGGQGNNCKLPSLVTTLRIRPIMNMRKAKACDCPLFTPRQLFENLQGMTGCFPESKLLEGSD